MDPWKIEEKNISCYCLHMGGLVVCVHKKNEHKCTYIGVIYVWFIFKNLEKGQSFIMGRNAHLSFLWFV
jgi:hypothetical protein